MSEASFASCLSNGLGMRWAGVKLEIIMLILNGIRKLISSVLVGLVLAGGGYQYLDDCGAVGYVGSFFAPPEWLESFAVTGNTSRTSSEGSSERTSGDVAVSGGFVLPAPCVKLENLGYTSYYDKDIRQPRLVVYEVGRGSGEYSGKRPKIGFSQDERVAGSPDSNSYLGSGYDRGHMAPSYAIGKWHGSKAQEETFKMTNISPQKHDFNDGVWNSLERIEADDFARRGAVKVFCGPVFLEDKGSLPSGIPVPSHFFKVFIFADGKEKAYLIPHCVGKGDPQKFVVPRSDVQKAMSSRSVNSR